MSTIPMAGKVKLTKAQERILIKARDSGDVLANGPIKRSCAMLVHIGLLERRKGRSRILTPAGRAHLASSGKTGE